MSIIYKLQNKTNNKVYIGQTTSNLKHRIGQHLTDKKVNTELSNDLKILGIENFNSEILIDGEFNSEELDLLEIIFINNFNSIIPNGYNSTTGGKKNYNLSENVKVKISTTLKGRIINWNEKISSSMKNKWEDLEYREKMIKAHSRPYGKYKKHTKPLRLELDLKLINELYKNGNSIYSIAKQLNVSFSVIKKRIKYEN
jgi:group I intron endonuclease